MTKRSVGSDGRESDGRSGKVEANALTPGRWFRVVGAFGALFLVTLAVGALVASCGQTSGTSAQSETHAQAVSPEQGTPAVVASVTPVGLPASGGSLTPPEADEVMPPDVTVPVVDTLVVPGQTMTFTVNSTGDATRVLLADGHGDSQPFVRLAGTNTWRVNYRVPLHPRQERYGVSITAKNDGERWRRVWVFLHIRGEEDGMLDCEGEAPDSTHGDDH